MNSKKQIKKKSNWIKVFFFFLVALLFLYSSGVIYSEHHTPTYEKSIKVNSSENGNYVISKGQALYDKEGNQFTLKGVNFGNYLIHEGWMSPFSLGAKKNSQGEYTSVNDDDIILEYNEVYEEDFIQALTENQNLNAQQIEELMQVYYDSYCQEEDFKNIKELGLNCIRLPMYYRNFMEGDDSHLSMKKNPFILLDAFIENCKKYDLFCILDLHGVVGGQNGYEHSGSKVNEFWDNEIYQQEMCELWKNIATHYQIDRPDLAYTIASYDLVNEPTKNLNEGTTSKKQWDVMDKLYQAIRSVDTKHIITFNACWFYLNFPNPSTYGWENIMYELHIYNWNLPYVTNQMHYYLLDLTYALKHYDVPYFIGEFNFFDNEKAWEKYLTIFDTHLFNWTIWSYKIISVGYWDNSFGIYVNKLNLWDHQEKLDIRSASFTQLYDLFSSQGTSESYSSTGVLYQALIHYFNKEK